MLMSSSNTNQMPDSIQFEDTTMAMYLTDFINFNPSQVSLTILHNGVTVTAINQNRPQVLDAISSIPVVLEVIKLIII